MTTELKTHPEMALSVQKLRALALLGNVEALDLLVELHRYDQRGLDIEEFGGEWKRSIEKAFANIAAVVD